MILPCSLQDYKAANKVAAEKEAQYLPKVPPAATPSGASRSSATGRETDIESQALLQEQKLIEARAMDNTIAFQEALIEERDHGIAGVVQYDSPFACRELLPLVSTTSVDFVVVSCGSASCVGFSSLQLSAE